MGQARGNITIDIEAGRIYVDRHVAVGAVTQADGFTQY